MFDDLILSNIIQYINDKRSFLSFSLVCNSTAKMCLYLVDEKKEYFRNKEHLYVPLQLWFNRNPSLALPTVALQYHEIRINLQGMDEV